MEVTYGQCMAEFPMWLLWYWLGIEHWGFHGMVLWVMHWDSMGLALGLLIGNAMEWFYG